MRGKVTENHLVRQTGVTQRILQVDNAQRRIKCSALQRPFNISLQFNPIQHALSAAQQKAIWADNQDKRLKFKRLTVFLIYDIPTWIPDTFCITLGLWGFPFISVCLHLSLFMYFKLWQSFGISCSAWWVRHFNWPFWDTAKETNKRQYAVYTRPCSSALMFSRCFLWYTDILTEYYVSIFYFRFPPKSQSNMW